MTDDQDVTFNSTHPHYMPSLNTLFREGGMEFTNFFVSTALCCPSRVSILRGQYCHNTGVHDNGDFNNSTYLSGGWAKFLTTFLEDETIATILQSQANYQTVFLGKYMNGYNDITNHPDNLDIPDIPGLHKPAGWDHWKGMIQNNFYGGTFSLDGEEIFKLPNDVYQTDYLNDQVIDFLRNHRDPDRPFFIMVLPFAPHAPADPADRHKDLYPDLQLPRTPRFDASDEIMAQKGAWIQNLPPLADDQLEDLDEFYRKRMRSLKAVDESLQNISDVLDELGLTEETYFMYTSGESSRAEHFSYSQ
jgi:arylsulfatase A-like enzyme